MIDNFILKTHSNLAAYANKQKSMEPDHNSIIITDRPLKIVNSALNPSIKANFFSTRPFLNKTDTNEITYQNRIFNVKKKFTVPSNNNEPLQDRKITIISDEKIRPKPSEVFAKYSDNVVRHRRLLRRGVWEVPFEPDTVAEIKKPRYRTEQQKESPKHSKMDTLQDHYHSTEQRRKKTQSTRNLDGWDARQLPSLRINHEIVGPIRLTTRYGCKPISCKTIETKEDSHIRDVMNRKLAVQIINYNLLGKWASSSFKI